MPALLSKLEHFEASCNKSSFSWRLNWFFTIWHVELPRGTLHPFPGMRNSTRGGEKNDSFEALEVVISREARKRTLVRHDSHTLLRNQPIPICGVLRRPSATTSSWIHGESSHSTLRQARFPPIGWVGLGSVDIPAFPQGSGYMG